MPVLRHVSCAQAWSGTKSQFPPALLVSSALPLSPTESFVRFAAFLQNHHQSPSCCTAWSGSASRVLVVPVISACCGSHPCNSSLKSPWAHEVQQVLLGQQAACTWPMDQRILDCSSQFRTVLKLTDFNPTPIMVASRERLNWHLPWGHVFACQPHCSASTA